MTSIKRFDASALNLDLQPRFLKPFLDSLRIDTGVATDGARTIDATVTDILDAVRSRGDEAVLNYTEKFDSVRAKSVGDLQVTAARIRKSLLNISREQNDALRLAAKRIKNYHKQQLRKSAKDWSYAEADGTILGQKISPIERVGIYVPGGKAVYPSTVLMTAIPARVAGVSEIIMVTPTPNGVMNDMVLAAAHMAGVDKIFTIGGAQAIAALAYGTSTIAPVDKIVGPGNIYVATAKKKLFGRVAIDMEAGPSEILVICDGQCNPEWIAMDLLSQAEHDEMAQAILISPDKKFLDQVEKSLEKLLPTLERCDIARRAIEGHSALIQVNDLDQAVEMSNYMAPEHLELAVENPQALLRKIKHAGAIFLGKYSSEALGDYVAGPSHVLPTSGTARFSSPLGVYDFQKRSSIIQCSAESASTLGKVASVLARGESLTAHARSLEARIKK